VPVFWNVEISKLICHWWSKVEPPVSVWLPCPSPWCSFQVFWNVLFFLDGLEMGVGLGFLVVIGSSSSNCWRTSL
jgi:hypothetical protein